LGGELLGSNKALASERVVSRGVDGVGECSGVGRGDVGERPLLVRVVGRGVDGVSARASSSSSGGGFVGVPPMG
jgi:hypothetical protein